MDAKMALQEMQRDASRSDGQSVILPPLATAPGSNTNTTNNGRLMSDEELVEMTSALLTNTEAAAVHALLELCQSQRQAPAGAWAELEAPDVDRLVGAYIHERFITRPDVAKAVHFQGQHLGMAACMWERRHLVAAGCVEKMVIAAVHDLLW